MKIEKEIRYYFSNDELPGLIKKLEALYTYDYSYHEVTTMYDNPNPEFTYYSEDIDGRLRLRYSSAVEAPSFGKSTSIDHAPSQCLITWKRRLPNTHQDNIRREEEVEYTAPATDFESVKAIFEDVLHCKRVSSYERIRNFLSADGVQVTCDEFPYGIMLELELKDDAEEGRLIEEVEKLHLNLAGASRLSCDDMYAELCKENGVTASSDILFEDKTMPKIK